MTKYHMSVNSQFTVVLNDIIYLFFSVRFCDNSLLVFDEVQGFTSDRKINVVVIITLSSTKP